MLLAAGAFADRARADPARFSWHGPDCAGSAALLESRLAELVEPRDRERLAGSVTATHQAGSYGVELSIDLDGRPLGTRRFDAASCARAAETAAVAASLAVYDGQGEPEGVAETGISLGHLDSASGADAGSLSPAFGPPQEPPSLLEARLGVLGSVEIGALPRAAWGGTLGLELGVGKRWSLGLLASMSVTQERAMQAAQSVHLSLLSGAARACFAPLSEARVRLDGCTGARLTQARGRGDGFDVSRTGSLTWVAPLLGVNFSLRGPSYIEWRAELEGAVPLSRRRFLVDGDEVARAASGRRRGPNRRGVEVLMIAVVETIAGAGHGDAPSFERVYDEFFDFVYRNARRLGVPPSAADDVVQEVFVVLHRRLAEYDGRALAAELGLRHFGQRGA